MAACAPPAAPPPPGPPPSPPAPTATAGGGAADRAGILRLEQEARALVRADGCIDSGQCRSAPVGSKACGGPRFWLPYCPLTTDVPALMARLTALQAAEQQFNKTYGIISDCSYVTEPALSVVGGSCRVR